MNRTPPTSRGQLRRARGQLLERGEIDGTLIDPALSRSWRRSLDFGLMPSGRAPGAPHASGAQLARALEQQHELVAHARPVMEYLFDQARDTDSMVILADAQGLLLQALGDARIVDRAQRVALRPGAIWHERWRGTNAIGTALAEGEPTVVAGVEHFLERNAFLTCTAAPIADLRGRLLGVLDISCDRRAGHRHTLALVRAAARMIEHRLFHARHAAGLHVRLHGRPEGVGTIAEGLVALDEEGWITGADAAARAMLDLRREDVGAVRIEHALQLGMPELWDWAAHGHETPRRVTRADGATLWLRAQAPRHVVATRGAVPLDSAVEGSNAAAASRAVVAAPDALAALDSADPAMHAAVDRARRVLDKPIALLLHGESGVGKEVFARAVHASGARRSGPFVAVNCAAMPDALIEAELFGYRPGAFTGASRHGSPGRIREAHGGTLLLDEIGDMPLALQARLLRVLQDRQVTPLGGGPAVPVDFRLVCATHRPLRALIECGRFREDLYYRINGLVLTLPPLRERADHDALVRRMLDQIAPQRGLTLAPDVARAMRGYRWPGNLRQLASALTTASALLDEGDRTIEWAHLPEDLAAELRDSGPRGRALCDEGADLRAQEERTVREVVQTSGGNLSEAARRLGISRNTLYRKLEQLGARPARSS